MRYRVKLTATVNKIGKQFAPEIKSAAREALNKLADDPFLGKELQGELIGFRSYRFMRYRIIYRIDPEARIVVIWAIGHRRDIYENFTEILLRQVLHPEEHS
jgi:mRNA interferase RelE/StbE